MITIMKSKYKTNLKTYNNTMINDKYNNTFGLTTGTVAILLDEILKYKAALIYLYIYI